MHTLVSPSTSDLISATVKGASPSTFWNPGQGTQWQRQQQRDSSGYTSIHQQSFLAGPRRPKLIRSSMSGSSASSGSLASSTTTNKSRGSSLAMAFSSTTSINTVTTDVSTYQSAMSCDSPASSLAADLSQNCHIDASPRMPTPRRSLLPSLSFHASNSNENCSTRPYKATTALAFASSASNSSPNLLSTATTTTNTTNTLDQSSPLPLKACTRPRFGMENRQMSDSCSPLPMRPLLSRLKAQSYSKPLPMLPAEAAANKENLDLTLGDLFNAAASPVRAVKSATMESLPVFSWCKEDVASHHMVAEPEDECMNKTNRPASRLAPFARPPKVRRTISMVQNAGEFVVPSSSAGLEPTGGVRILPCFTIKDDPLKRINHETLLSVLDGKYASLYDEHVIVDCRFPYEYEGGHVEGAFNINTIDALHSQFFLFDNNAQLCTPIKRNLIIFHCEYSAHRAPRMYESPPKLKLVFLLANLR